jgi:hypothetical protein
MIPQAPLDPIPKLAINNRRMLAFVHNALMSDLADVDWVGEDLIDMPPGKETPTCRSPLAVEADRKANVLGVKDFLQASDVADFEIAPEQPADEFGVVLDSVETISHNQFGSDNVAGAPAEKSVGGICGLDGHRCQHARTLRWSRGARTDFGGATRACHV